MFLICVVVVVAAVFVVWLLLSMLITCQRHR